LGKTDGLYYFQNVGAWGGSCYGFSAASLLFYKDKYQPESYQSSASVTYDLSAPGAPNAALTKLIEKYQVSQFIGHLQYVKDQNKDEMRELITAVSDSEKPGGDPVVVCVSQGRSGHAVVGYHVEQTSAGYEIWIYDNNYPGQKRILKINNGMTSFEYPMGGQFGTWGTAAGGVISFVPISAIEADTRYQELSYVLLSASSIEGNIENGSHQKLQDIPGVIEVHPYTDSPQENSFFMLPKDSYTIEPSAQMNVAMASSDAYVKIEGLGANDKLSGDMNSAKLIDVETAGESTFNVTCVSKDTGFQEIEMEVTTNGSFAAEMADGKLKLSGDAQVTVTAGEEVVDQTELGETYAVVVNFTDSGEDAKVTIVGPGVEKSVNAHIYAIFEGIPNGSYRVDVEYLDGSLVSQDIQVNSVTANIDGVVNVVVSK
jgi:hypothetical protein